jgi:hypothetical protein
MAEQKLNAKLGADTSEFDRKLKTAEAGVNKFGSALSFAAKAALATFSVGAIVNFTKESIKLASVAEGIKDAFQTLAKPGLLNDLQKATRGTVDDVKLMQKAIQARNFKIPLEELATYFQFATNRAIQTGESVDYLVDSIITGIGRKSVLVMDNLGISAVQLQEEVKKTGDFGRAAGEIIKRELEKAGEVVDTTATKFATLGASIKNIKTALGERIIESQFFQDVIGGLNIVAGKLEAKPGQFAGLSKEQLEAEKTNKQSGYEAQISRLGEIQGKINDLIEKSSIAKYTQQYRDLKKQLSDTEVSAEDYKNQVSEINGLLKVLNSSTEDLGGINKDTGITIDAIISKLREEAREAKKVAEALSILKKEIGGEAPSKAYVPGLPSLGSTLPESGGLRGQAPHIQEQYEAGLDLNRMIAANAAEEEKMTQALMRQDYAVGVLADSFSSLFSSTGDGFNDMIDTMIAGIERLIAEMLANKVMDLIGGYFTGSEGMTLYNPWSSGGKSGVNKVLSPSYGQVDVKVSGNISGKDMKWVSKRW